MPSSRLAQGPARGRTVALSLAFAAAAVVAPRGAGEAEPVATGVPIALTYWSAPNADELSYARALAGTWNAGHPGIVVNVEPIPASGSSEEVLLAAVVAKTTPDICANVLPSIMNRFVRARAVVALDGFADFRRVASERIGAQALAFARSDDGHVYQLPWKANPVMLAYNVDVFAARHVRVPRTYADFMAAARRLTYASVPGGPIDRYAMSPGTSVTWWWRMFDFYPLYAAAAQGRTLLDSQHRLADPRAARAAFAFFATGFARGYFPRAAPQPDLFLEGRAAMRLGGPWTLRYLERARIGHFKVGFAPLPVPAATRAARLPYTFADQKNIAIFSTTRHPRESWEFVKYLTSKAADRTLLEMTDQIPLRRDVARDPYFHAFFAGHPSVAAFAAQSARVVPLDDSPHIVQLLDYLSQQYEASAIYGLIPPAEAAENTAGYVANIDAL